MSDIPRTSGIYWIRNLVNLKYYVGSAKDFVERRKAHFNALRGGRHVNSHLQRAFDRYGETNFVFEVLGEFSLDGLRELETSYIADLGATNPSNGYNICPTGCGWEGMTHTEEAKELIRIAVTEKWKDEEHRRAISEKVSKTLTGRKLSAETIAKRTLKQHDGLVERNKSEKQRALTSAAMMGHEVSRETRDKISKSLVGITPTEEAKKNHLIAVTSLEFRERVSRSVVAHWNSLTLEQQEERMIGMRGKSPKGSEHYNAVVDEDIVREMREMFDAGTTVRELATHYELRYLMVYKIVKRQTWRHVA